MAHPRKLGRDVSIGEFDAATGLTHVTHQRGRLLFNMGASVKKQQRRELDDLVETVTSTPASWKGKSPVPTHSIRTFTGLSLYPEEANYLVQRGALVIYCTSAEDKVAKEVSGADFTALLARDANVSLACLDVYSFLKEQKLHPRRCLEPVAAIASGGHRDGRSVPHHVEESTGSCDVAFDVWKTVSVDVLLPRTNAEQATQSSPAAIATAKNPRPRKKLGLVFRVAVCRYWDIAPSQRSFRQLLQRSKARDCGSSSGSSSLTCGQVPVKLAVVHHDRSVLLFEISDM
uniref:tRNA-splicing endonuclease subunit Sen54 N-terminal domain-containing protein n=1 Tax=Peronospora matthiolae TaxID=2874970 RepID=A0AAV1TMN3_9STRA